jgi:outer membrane protein TolC
MKLSVCIFILSAAAAPGRARAQDAATAPPPATRDEAELTRGARLETVLRVALERNPELAADHARAMAAEAAGQAAARLPDAELKYEQWGVPLARPYALDRADTLMLGVRQSFPAWGTLDSSARAAREEAGVARDDVRARRQTIAAEVRRAYAAYYKSDQELRLHLEHVGLTSRVIELGRLNQRTGHGGLQDVLRLELELTRLHADVAHIESEQRSSRARLNTLMDRAPDAPLGPPEDLGAAPAAVAAGDVAALERGLDQARPEVGAAARALRRREALLDETHRAARYPSVMVGLDYWYLPTAADTRHAYGAMVAINLPWLSERRRDEEREAERLVQADRHALQSARDAVRFQLRDAAARLESARQSFAIIDQDLLAQARRNLEAAEAAYAAGQGDTSALLDALRTYLQVRIERVQALADLASSRADLERAAGIIAADGGGP